MISNFKRKNVIFSREPKSYENENIMKYARWKQSIVAVTTIHVIMNLLETVFKCLARKWREIIVVDGGKTAVQEQP